MYYMHCYRIVRPLFASSCPREVNLIQSESSFQSLMTKCKRNHSVREQTVDRSYLFAILCLSEFRELNFSRDSAACSITFVHIALRGLGELGNDDRNAKADLLQNRRTLQTNLRNRNYKASPNLRNEICPLLPDVAPFPHIIT